MLCCDFSFARSSHLAVAAILGLCSPGILQGQRSRGFFWPSATRQVFVIWQIAIGVVALRKPYFTDEQLSVVGYNKAENVIIASIMYLFYSLVSHDSVWELISLEKIYSSVVNLWILLSFVCMEVFVFFLATDTGAKTLYRNPDVALGS